MLINKTKGDKEMDASILIMLVLAVVFAIIVTRAAIHQFKIADQKLAAWFAARGIK